MKLLVSDYDNTIELHYDFTDNKSILKRNIIAINKFREKNIFCIATGRHFDAIYNTLKENNINFDYLCANNGAELYDSDYNLLYSLPIEIKDLAIIKSLNQDIYYRTPYNSKLITSVNIYMNDINEYNNMRKYLDKNLKSSYVEYKFPKIKIINNKCNKCNTIEIIKNMIEIDNNDIYTIGDDINDEKMILNYNGYSIKTANDNIKIIANKIYDELNNLISDII